MTSHDKPKLKKIIGLRNIVTDGKEWKYLLFYDVDNQSEETIDKIMNLTNTWAISFIIYKTKHGIHFIGLTPLNIVEYSLYFNQLQTAIGEYYSGQTIRLSRKEVENQELIGFNLEYPTLKNLLSIYEKRFPSLLVSKDVKMVKGYSLVFEKYWSVKK